MTDISTTLDSDDFDYPKSAPADRSARGPLDDQEAGSVKPAIDLGALRVEPRRGLQMRLEVEKNTNRVVAVTLEYQGSSVQVQPFAAPRSSGLWLGIREQIAGQVAKQGGKVENRDGQFGPELLANVPVQSAQGYSTRTVRFIGVDGPRWFLRGVISGPAASDPVAAETIHEIFRGIVVVRGNTPMPPRELLGLRAPESSAGTTGGVPPAAPGGAQAS
ncbi:DUF3710-like protein [Pontimonas salivibrio]|uniref:DUF3710-like protein n=1 Tax=Pontimonas salivibrio TaxID=1159327 RepID=A0A2L2BQH2_9MICO|nr:DUF3710 domain-containing protein [Pontimonas salivibrio]AVG23910.1 DUF3710-like protein [Pontimonas salivibrio]